MRIAGRIIAIVIIPLLVFGLLRFGVHGFQGDLLPSSDTFMAWFDNFPDLTEAFRNASKNFNAHEGDMCPVWALDSYGLPYETWQPCQNNAIDYVNGFFQMAFAIIGIPFSMLGWFFSIIFY